MSTPQDAPISLSALRRELAAAKPGQSVIVSAPILPTLLDVVEAAMEVVEEWDHAHDVGLAAPMDALRAALAKVGP